MKDDLHKSLLRIMTRSKEPSFKTNEYALYGETDFWTRGDLSVSLSERRLNGMDFSLQLHYRATRLLWQRFWRCRARRSITTGSGAAATTFVFMSASPSFSLAVRAAVTYLAASSAKAQLAFSLAAFVAAFRHFLRVLRNWLFLSKFTELHTILANKAQRKSGIGKEEWYW